MTESMLLEHGSKKCGVLSYECLGLSLQPELLRKQFPRDSWTFAGYSTPEAALVSAVWAMKEGKPQVFLDSLSAEEQARMAKAWENKSEDEIAAKHQQDVSQITGVRVTGHDSARARNTA